MKHVNGATTMELVLKYLSMNLKAMEIGSEVAPHTDTDRHTTDVNTCTRTNVHTPSDTHTQTHTGTIWHAIQCQVSVLPISNLPPPDTW